MKNRNHSSPSRAKSQQAVNPADAMCNCTELRGIALRQAGRAVVAFALGGDPYWVSVLPEGQIFDNLGRGPFSNEEFYSDFGVAQLRQYQTLNVYVIVSGWVAESFFLATGDGHMPGVALAVATVDRVLHAQESKDDEGWLNVWQLVRAAHHNDKAARNWLRAAVANRVAFFRNQKEWARVTGIALALLAYEEFDGSVAEWIIDQVDAGRTFPEFKLECATKIREALIRSHGGVEPLEFCHNRHYRVAPWL